MINEKCFRDPDALHIQSNGGGVQSICMYYQSCLGFLPRFDYSIFVNLGAEKPGTIKAIQEAKKWAVENNGIPIIEITNMNLATDTIDSITGKKDRFVSIPFFSSGTDGSIGMIRRQCTSEYKIRQVNQCIKHLQGKSGNQRYDPAYVWLGITIDEISRLSSPEPVKFTNVFPYCNYKTGYDSGRLSFRDPGLLNGYYHRMQCIRWLLDNNFKVPPKSSCLFCPYTSDADWLDMKKNDPDTFALAVEFDHSIRIGKPGKTNSLLYLHRSGLPLDEVVFKPHNSGDLFECSGHCHV